MDSLTQGILGAAAAQACLQHRLGRGAWLAGALGGMAPDLDILIRSSSDPLVGWVYHRHFTHSLLFVPFGGAAVGIPLALRHRDPSSRPWVLAAAMLGYATHGLLDALTAYGTQLLWPLSRMRIALDAVAIIDLLYTLPLLVGVILAARRRSRRPARVALLLTTLYLGLGAVQNHRARAAVAELAAARGHRPERLEAGPRPMFHLLWRTYYRYDGRIYVDAVRTGWFGDTRTFEGGSVVAATEAHVPPDPVSLHAFRTFRWFTRGWVGVTSDEPAIVGDVRYSPSFLGTEPMWGLVLRQGQPPARYRSGVRRDAAVGRYLDIIFDRK